jgi:shikimate kinase
MNIYLTGFMGSGKSTAGQLLAAKMRRKFIDTDSEIERRKGMEVTEIFKRYGEFAFRELEKELLGELSLKTDLVVATGGGMVLNPQNVERMKGGVMFYLKAPVDVLAGRLSRQRATRPLIAALHEDELPGFITKQLSEREPLYQMAHFSINADQPAEAVCDEIEKLLRNYSR